MKYTRTKTIINCLLIRPKKGIYNKKKKVVNNCHFQTGACTLNTIQLRIRLIHVTFSAELCKLKATVSKKVKKYRIFKMPLDNHLIRTISIPRKKPLENGNHISLQAYFSIAEALTTIFIQFPKHPLQSF